MNVIQYSIIARFYSHLPRIQTQFEKEYECDIIITFPFRYIYYIIYTDCGNNYLIITRVNIYLSNCKAFKLIMI